MKRFFKAVEKEGVSKKPTIHSVKNGEETTDDNKNSNNEDVSKNKKEPTKFLTWNANSFLLRVKNNWPEFTKFLQEFDPDVIAIQVLISSPLLYIFPIGFDFGCFVVFYMYMFICIV